MANKKAGMATMAGLPVDDMGPLPEDAHNARVGREIEKSYQDQIDSGQIIDSDGLTERAISQKPVTPQGSNTTDLAANVAMSSGNPYAMAVGKGLEVISMADQRENAQRNDEYQAKHQRLQRQQEAISRLVDISNGLRRL